GVPRVVRAEEVLYILRAQDLEGFLQELHDLHTHDIEMAEGGELQVVPQIQPGTAHDGDAAEAGIVGALAHHVADPFVAPEQRDLVYEMTKLVVEIHVWSRALWNRGIAVTECTTIGHQPIVERIAQHIATVEL